MYSSVLREIATRLISREYLKRLISIFGFEEEEKFKKQFQKIEKACKNGMYRDVRYPNAFESPLLLCHLIESEKIGTLPWFPSVVTEHDMMETHMATSEIRINDAAKWEESRETPNAETIAALDALEEGEEMIRNPAKYKRYVTFREAVDEVFADLSKKEDG